MDYLETLEAIRQFEGREVAIEIRANGRLLGEIQGVLSEGEMTVADPELGVSAVARLKISDGLQGRLVEGAISTILLAEEAFDLGELVEQGVRVVLDRVEVVVWRN